jgi:hypothetical protein
MLKNGVEAQAEGKIRRNADISNASHSESNHAPFYFRYRMNEAGDGVEEDLAAIKSEDDSEKLYISSLNQGVHGRALLLSQTLCARILKSQAITPRCRISIHVVNTNCQPPTSMYG